MRHPVEPKPSPPHPVPRARAQTPVWLWPLIAVALAASLASAVAAASPPAPAFLVVAHPEHSEDAVDAKFLARAFLKKTTTWPDGSPLRPVDQKMDSPVRQRFSQDILQRSVLAVRNYWQQMIFAGRGVPPPELESDDAVIRHVLRHQGAVGYVSAAASVGNAKVLQLR